MRRSWGRFLVVDGLIVAGWLTSVGAVVLHERGGLLDGLSNPATSLGATLEAKEQWFGIYYQGQPIGFSHTMLVPEEHEGVPGVAVVDQGRLFFSLLGSPQELEVTARAFIDADWRLQLFSASIHTTTQRLAWSGRRHGDALLVTLTTPTSSVTKQLKDPTGSAFVSGLSSWAAFHRLRVGQSGRTWVLNPLALSPEAVYFTVRRSEDLGGRRTLVVESDVAGMTTTSWVTPEGEVIKETSPLGWELRQESRDNALAHLAHQHTTLDLLSAASVPIDRILDDPERITRLTLLVQGMEEGSVAIQRPWQRVLPPERLADYQRTPPEGPWCIVQLDRPTSAQPSQRLPPTIQHYLQPSLFVESADPRIIAKANDIIGSRTDPWERMQALEQWVYATLTKRFTIGLPSAVDILATPTGDCHEHTVLFTALARSVGLPTRMVAGLVYQGGRFFYHAWPEVWMDQWSPHLAGAAEGSSSASRADHNAPQGQTGPSGHSQVGGWLPTDPTLAQRIADATHLGLSEAENESLITLGHFIGKLRVSVLSVEPAR